MAEHGADNSRRKLLTGSILGDYVLTERIGKGFFGRVYSADCRRTDQTHAVKVFRSEICRQPGFTDGFSGMLHRLQALKHTNITTIHTGSPEPGPCWFAMDRAPGDGTGAVTLQDLSDRFGGILEASTLIGIMGGVLRGVAAAHEHGIVHGNLKPGNVLLYRLPDKRLAAKVADFGWVGLVGLQWYLDRCRHAVKYSMKNRIPVDSRGDSFRALLKSREYMSPEQEKTGAVDQRSDVYAVGLMFYRLICGTKLSPRPPSHYNPVLNREHDRFILRALEPEPSDRYADAGAMLEALEPVRELINRELEQQRRIEIGRQVGDIRNKAAALVAEERYEEARDLLYDLMQEYPGRRDVFEDYSAIEDRIIEKEAIANQEEQYHWDSMEARELEAAGNLKGALKVWTILARLFPHKDEAVDEVRRLMAVVGNAMEDDSLADQETAEGSDLTPAVMAPPPADPDGCTPADAKREPSPSPRTARERVERYRRERNRAWDLADAGHFADALVLLAGLKADFSDRDELVTELELIKEETLEAQTAARRAQRHRIAGWVIAGMLCVGLLALAYFWMK